MREILTFIIWTLMTSCYGQVEDIFRRGRVALTNRNYGEAVEYFDKVINLNPSHENALLLRSQANYSLKNYELVIKDCEKILQINSNVITQDDLAAIWNLGVVFNSLRQFGKARNYFQDALKYDS
jgi:tetratricopeptide (TPR) repeat protein